MLAEIIRNFILVISIIVGLITIAGLPAKFYYEWKCKKLHEGEDKSLCGNLDCTCFEYCHYANTRENEQIRELHRKDKEIHARIYERINRDSN